MTDNILPIVIDIGCCCTDESKTIALGCPQIVDQGESGIKVLFQPRKKQSACMMLVHIAMKELTNIELIKNTRF
jgi:hypothetical protein